MLPLVTRILKRIAVLLFGALVIYLAVWKVFPFFDNRTPVAIALFVTYVAMAYGVIPALFRVYRLLYNPVHIPLYCTTPDGFASDPINIALVGNRPQVILAMEAAGWKQADPKTPTNVVRQILFAALRRSYPSAPMSTLYLFGRKQDLSFEKEIAGSRGHRHHVRFWTSDTELAEEFAHHARFWQRFHRPGRRHPSAQFWVGAATKDVGFAPIRHNAQVTHMIDPNTNSERQLIVRDLKRAKQLRSSRMVLVRKPFSLRNRAWRGFLRSDGKIIVCNLK